MASICMVAGVEVKSSVFVVTKDFELEVSGRFKSLNVRSRQLCYLDSTYSVTPNYVSAA